MDITQYLLGSNDNNYQSLLPFSYMVPTFYPVPPGDAQPQGGAPLIALDDEDLQARAQRLVNVLYWTATTYKDADGMSDSQTLKVFIAPEFYFRKASDAEAVSGQFTRNTSFGSYPEDVRYQLAEALYDAIQTTPLFKDWVIVAGTVCSVLPEYADRLNLLNTAIMLRGQRSAPDASVPYVLMEKHYISHIDGPPQDWHANIDPTTVYSFTLNPDQELDNLIYWNRMMLGLEVCLDHSRQVVRNAVNQLRATLGPNMQPLNLQLVTSCGMSIVNQALAVEDGALVMLTDGYCAADDGLREPIFQLGRYDATAGAVTLVGPGNLQFQELPKIPSYQVHYAQGLYEHLGRRQGVWASTSKLPLRLVQVNRCAN
ncbi:MAG: hypothetical protein ACJ8IK_20460 [Burkholderiaceae bacterium]